MTYKFRIGLRSGWLLTQPGGESIALHGVLELLAAIDATGNITAACRQCGVSYRHAWGLLRRFEVLFGAPLLVTQRRRGTHLSPFGERLLWANRRIEARLTPTLESLASELQEELESLLPQSEPHLRLHVSHGFAVEALMQLLAERPPAVELRYRTAIEALAALDGGECDLAGFQVPMGEFEAPMLEQYGRWLRPNDHVLVELARRQTGLFVRPGNPKRIHGMSDLARADVRFVNRQIGSSTRLLAHLLLERAGVPAERVNGFETAEFTHMAVAAHIASGMADTGLGVRTAAARFGLDFVPIADERYFFAVRRAMLHTGSMQALLEILRGPTLRQALAELPGYDATHAGRAQTFDEAFA
ncbi:LysR family transcriptional regulator [Verticiella sediminum]|uniref:LysR family transcriptional regulator n=1 Tax=Verticiella sediminum TaxID=1247510 RepID=A0A556A880_9BURK|nr:substrate-binding domain-containing protein [Verticiella sediminum]TSH89091.1 LysR family transcriptional regulator [Verticiella sediminum]